MEDIDDFLDYLKYQELLRKIIEKKQEEKN